MADQDTKGLESVTPVPSSSSPQKPGPPGRRKSLTDVFSDAIEDEVSQPEPQKAAAEACPVRAELASRSRKVRKSVFEMPNKGKLTQKIASGWLNKSPAVRRTRPADTTHGGQDFNHWVEDDCELSSRSLIFKTIGKTPVDVPMFPARLTPVRFMSPSPPLYEPEQQPAAIPEQQPASSAGDAAGPVLPSSAESGELAVRRHPPRSFSRQCKHVMVEQDSIQPLDVISIYLACDFFKTCQRGFVRELVLSGGPQAWRGVSVPPHMDVYLEGDQGHSLFVVARGQVGMMDRAGIKVREYGISDCFGEAQVLGITSRRLETMRAISYCQLLVTTQSTLTKLLRRTKEDDYHGESMQRRNSTIKQSSLFHEERRHFEGESVRMYKEFSGGTGTITTSSSVALADCKARGRRGTAFKQQGGGHLMEVDSAHKARAAELRAVQAQQEKTAAAVAGDDGVEALQARDRLFTKVISSIREDMRKGFMMPADVSIEGIGERRPKAGETKPGKGAVQAPMVLIDGCKKVEEEEAEDRFGMEDDDYEAFVQDNTSPLDPHCLPPMALLNPMQKHGILRQLRHLKKGKANTTNKCQGSLRRASREIAAESLMRLSKQPGLAKAWRRASHGEASLMDSINLLGTEE